MVKGIPVRPPTTLAIETNAVSKGSEQSNFSKIMSFASHALKSITGRLRALTHTSPMSKASYANQITLNKCIPAAPPSPIATQSSSMRSDPGDAPSDMFVPSHDPESDLTGSLLDKGVERASTTASTLDLDDIDLPRIVSWEDDFDSLCEDIFPEGDPYSLSDQSELSVDVEDELLSLMRERCEINAQDPRGIGSARTQRNAKKMAVILLNTKEAKLSAINARPRPTLSADAAEKSFREGAPRHQFDPSRSKYAVQARYETVEPFFDIVLPNQTST